MRPPCFAILLGGRLTVTERLKHQLAGARVIAADGGIGHAGALGLAVELWLGDFDSSEDALLARHADIPRRVFPAAKDATDGELAVEEAIRLGARSLVLVGGLGGQSDHALAHYTLALALARRGIDVLVTSGDEEGYPLLPGAHTLDLPAGSRLSIVALSDVEGLTLKGVSWPLTKRNVPLGSSLTLSNEACAPVRIDLRSGYGVAIAYPAGGGLSHD